MTIRLDAHQHFWRYDAVQYPWIPVGSPLERDWLPVDLQSVQLPLALDGSIVVQARQSRAESDWLLGLADADPRIHGVIGWVDLRSKEVSAVLTRLARHPRFVGVRHVLQDEPDDRFALHPEFVRGIGLLQDFDLTYDLLIYPRQLAAAIELVSRFPEQSFVLDHLAKPEIRAGRRDPWEQQIRELATLPNVCCKISGMVTEADHAHWRPEHFRPYLDTVFAAFGPSRLMWGSDWPVCLLAGSYEEVYRLVEDYSGRLSADERAALFGGNCAAFYLRHAQRSS
jgi:L-fuconolactonase